MLPQRATTTPVHTRVDDQDAAVELVHREAHATGIVTGADPVRTFVVVGDRQIVAHFVPDTINVRYDERLTTTGLRWRVWGITLIGHRISPAGNERGRRIERTFDLADADLPAVALQFALDAQPDPHGYAIHAPGTDGA